MSEGKKKYTVSFTEIEITTLLFILNKYQEGQWVGKKSNKTLEWLIAKVYKSIGV